MKHLAKFLYGMLCMALLSLLTSCGSISENEFVQRESNVTVCNQDWEIGTFQVKISNVEDFVGQADSVNVAVWSAISDTSGNEQDDICWYTTYNYDGAWFADILLSKRNYDSGYYFVYVSVNNLFYGNALIVVPEDDRSGEYIDNPPGVLQSNYDWDAGTFRVSILNVSTYTDDVQSLGAYVWSAKAEEDGGSQGELHWYDASEKNGVWYVDVDTSQHECDYGSFAVHVFLNNTFYAETTAKIPKVATATCDYNWDAGTFRIKVLHVDRLDKNVNSLLVSVWSSAAGKAGNEKDDAIWYPAYQKDGAWFADVNLANHGYDTGLYYAAVYVNNEAVVTDSILIPENPAYKTMKPHVPYFLVSGYDRKAGVILLEFGNMEFAAGNIRSMGIFLNNVTKANGKTDKIDTGGSEEAIKDGFNTAQDKGDTKDSGKPDTINTDDGEKVIKGVFIDAQRKGDVWSASIDLSGLNYMPGEYSFQVYVNGLKLKSSWTVCLP